MQMTNILDILVCPVTKGRLEYDTKQQLLISRQAKLAFPIKNHLPILQIEEAFELDSLIDNKQVSSTSKT